MPIVVCGNVFVDIKGFPESKYIPAGRNSGWVEFVHGGVGRNVVEDIANVELRPRFVSMVDDTAQGEDVIRKLNQHKVDTRFVSRVPDGMGIWLAIHDAGGDIASSLSKRPNMDAMLALLEEHGDEIFADADSVEQVFHYAGKYGKRIYAVVANMSIATQRRDFLQMVDCFVCNVQEAGILFAAEFEGLTPEEMSLELRDRVASAHIPAMVVTMGSQGAVFASMEGECGVCPAQTVHVRDTAGAGDAFFAGVAIGLTYGKSLMESCQIGSRLASSVITVSENTCPRFLPEELGLDVVISES